MDLVIDVVNAAIRVESEKEKSEKGTMKRKPKEKFRAKILREGTVDESGRKFQYNLFSK